MEHFQRKDSDCNLYVQSFFFKKEWSYVSSRVEIGKWYHKQQSQNGCFIGIPYCPIVNELTFEITKDLFNVG